ncbi:MAG: hypothetical protein AAGI07_01945 [Bacteroidota bacterium]
MTKVSYSHGNINLFQRSYYKRKAAKYLGTSDPVTMKKYLEAKKKKEEKTDK